MKNLFKLFCFVVCFQALEKVSAQVPFAPIGAKWTYYQFLCEDEDVVFNYFTNRVLVDTVIQGKTCSLVDNINLCPANESCDHENYVYQEGSKVFIYEPDLDSFQMLYDFSLQAGASYKYNLCDFYWGNDSVTIYVDSADAGLEGFQYLKILFGNSTDGIDVPIIKGVGGIKNNPLLFPEACASVEPCIYTQLYCYETPETGIVQFPGSCTTSRAKEKNVIMGQCFMYPNPSRESTTLTSHQSLQNGSAWSIVDQYGRLVANTELALGKQSWEISLSGIAPGMYFWRVNTEGRQVANGKLIIQK